MGKRGIRLTSAERKDKSRKAYQLAIRRVTYEEIGKLLGISRQLASKLVQQEQERLWLERDLSELEKERQKSVNTYDEIIRGAWQRLERIPDRSTNLTGLYNVLLTAQKQIDAIIGITNTAIGDDIAAKAQAYLDLLDTNAPAEDLSE